MIETKALIPVTVKSEGFGPIIFRTKDSVYHFYQYYGIMPSMGDEHHNLYFIEDRKIKEGVDEWYIDDFLSKPRSSGGAQYKDKQKVIVATTNQSLIEKGVPAIPEEYVRHYCYKNGDIGSVDIEMESVYIEPEGIHSNRGDWKITPKLGENSLGEPEVIVYHEPAPMVDWNQFTMTQFIEHLENEFRFSSTGTAKAVFELIKANKDMREGLEWIKKEYVENVNEQDAITEKIDNLLKEKH
jgi:hypothetical protein